MHHLCLVSDQTMPNFLPCIDEALRPSRITLAVTKAMKARAEDLRRAYERYKTIEVQPNLEIADATDLAALSECFTAWLDAHDSEEVCLNVTGGTKLMAIAAQECFRMANKKVFYIDIASDRVLWVDTPKQAPLVLQAEPTVEAAIELNGFDILPNTTCVPARQQAWTRFAEVAAQNIETWRAALTYLNKEAQEGENANDTILRRPEEALYQWDTVLEALQQHGLLKTETEDSLEFLNIQARDFVKGGWLEHYVRRVCNELGFRNRNFRSNLTIRTRHAKDGSKADNELDAVFLYRNSLYLVECKARNFRQGKKGDTRVDNALYKLTELTRQQGLRAKALFVSMKSLAKADQERAKALGVQVFDNLATLKDDLKAYLGL